MLKIVPRDKKAFYIASDSNPDYSKQATHIYT